jgi:hypothetical protein
MTASLVIVRLIFYSSQICRAASTSAVYVPTQWSLRRSFAVVKACAGDDVIAAGRVDLILVLLAIVVSIILND